MSNSSLICYTGLSPNHSGKRTQSIDRITPHCVVGQLSCETICACFPAGRNASCNYGIGSDGRISLCVDEGNRSWCTSSNANDQRAVTIECASDKTEPYAMTDAVYNSLINLCVDICKRNGKTKLLWFADKNTTLNYSPKSGEMVLTVHRWFANKSCPGDWLYSRLGDLAAKVTAKLGGSSDSTGTQATAFKGLSEADAIAKVGALFTANQKESGILASVSLAQFILESGYGQSELAQNANNVFGMKCSLSGNTWSGSTWDGTSKYTKQTNEEYTVGTITTVTADFRKYSCVEDSIADHAAYLLGAMNGSTKRYEGLKGCTDYKKAITIIKNGGYATSSTYIENVCNIIEKWGLTKYDVSASSSGSTTTNSSFPAVPFTVQVIIDDLNIRTSPTSKDDSNLTGKYTGKGTFTITEVSGSWGKLKSGAGWIYLGNTSYVTINGTTADSASSQYMVRVKVSDLNIRKDATIDAASVGVTGKGTFTIVAEKTGKVSKDGTVGKWGLLKSYAEDKDGWICLAYSDYTEKV